MRLIQKSGPADAITSTYAANGSIIVNLKERWPQAVRFDARANELVISLDEKTTVRLRSALPVIVDQLEIEKDQVTGRYRLAD